MSRLKHARIRGLLPLLLVGALAGCDDEQCSAPSGGTCPSEGPADALPPEGADTGPSVDAAPDADPPVDAAPDAEASDPAALSTASVPTRPEAWYVDQALLYFDTLDIRADPALVPEYTDGVARWEWPPWLYLTGYGAQQMIATTRAALRFDPSTVEDRDCRFFPTQPFARCYVNFVYAGGDCPIYEEFTFNGAGEMSFLEAWSVRPGLMPVADHLADPWAEGPDAHRLSTRIPGLGSPAGLIDPEAPWMAEAAAADPEIADFVRRARDFWGTWREAYDAAGPDVYAIGCGWDPKASPEE